jgi:hypothetical protein
MESYEEYDVDVLARKMHNLEKELIDLHDRYLTLSDALKATQHYMVKMAQQQAMIATQVSHWPYIAVEKQSVKRKDKE